MDWEWSYLDCASCQSTPKGVNAVNNVTGTCLTTGSCFRIQDPHINIRHLVLYTKLPELWQIFTDVVNTSPLDANGFLTLGNMQAYLSTLPELPVAVSIFWECMSYFLSRRNHKIYLDRKRKVNHANSSR